MTSTQADRPAPEPSVHLVQRQQRRWGELREVLDQIQVANFKDNVQSWELQSDGCYRRRTPKRRPFSAHACFMANPSLSGREPALQEIREIPRLRLEES